MVRPDVFRPMRAHVSGRRGAAAAFAACLVFVAGCLTSPNATHSDPEGITSSSPSFTTPTLIDPVRSGGEPVILALASGTLLVAAHAGVSHAKLPPSPQDVTAFSGQTNVFRSTDDGASWSVVTGGLSNQPRNDAIGMSDPALVASSDGSLVVLAHLGTYDPIGVEISNDDGKSWPRSAPIANALGQIVDRPWLARLGSTYYLAYNTVSPSSSPIAASTQGIGGWQLRSSTDGLAWQDVSNFGDGSFNGGLIGDPKSGALYAGNGDKVWVSLDGGNTFHSSSVTSAGKSTPIAAQPPAVDANGTVYFAWSDWHQVWLAASHDHGMSWSNAIAVSSGTGTAIWPWPVAGDTGKVGVAWLEANESAPNADGVKGEWTVHVALIDGADTPAPHVWSGSVPGTLAMKGPICTDGPSCEKDGKDRRLGDFLTCNIDRHGRMVIAYATTATGHAVASPLFVRQTNGPVLRKS